MAVVLVTIAIFMLVVAFMAVGVIFRGKCLRGSCGGDSVIGPDGEPLSCATCPNRNRQRASQVSSDCEDGECERERSERRELAIR